jgi:hypothetical protein
MRRKSLLLSVIFVGIFSLAASSLAFAGAVQEGQKANASKTTSTSRRRRHVRRHRRHGAKQDYANAGKSAGHGGKRFGKNIKHGKPVKAGKELGKGVGGMGKGVGHGTKRVGKKVGKTIKKAVTP